MSNHSNGFLFLFSFFLQVWFQNRRAKWRKATDKNKKKTDASSTSSSISPSLESPTDVTDHNNNNDNNDNTGNSIISDKALTPEPNIILEENGALGNNNNTKCLQIPEKQLASPLGAIKTLEPDVKTEHSISNNKTKTTRRTIISAITYPMFTKL